MMATIMFHHVSNRPKTLILFQTQNLYNSCVFGYVVMFNMIFTEAMVLSNTHLGVAVHDF